MSITYAVRIHVELSNLFFIEQNNTITHLLKSLDGMANFLGKVTLMAYEFYYFSKNT